MSEKLTNLPDGVAAGALFYLVSGGVSSKATGGAANGVATLDGSGKIPASLIPLTGLTFEGVWDAATNVPALANGVGTDGAFYIVQVGGTRNLGAGELVYEEGELVLYEGAQWHRVGVETAVVSVNAKTGAVVLTATDVGALASPVGGGASTVVGWNVGGSYSAVPYSQNTTGFNLVMRLIDGNLPLPAPTDPTHATNKSYVDTGLATKLEKKTDLNTVYAVNPSGDPAMIPYTGSAATANTVALRDAAGRVKVADPAVASDASTKGYVDTQVSARVPSSGAANVLYGTAGAGVQTTLPHATGPTVSSVVVRDTAGRTQVVDPAAPADVATKAYVDATVVASGVSKAYVDAQIDTRVAVVTQDAVVYATDGLGGPVPIKWDAAAAPNALALRGADGALLVATPTSAGHAATKAYVDAAVGSAGGAVQETTEASKIYGTNGTGQQTTFGYNDGLPTEGNILRYIAGGALRALPPEDSDPYGVLTTTWLGTNGNTPNGVCRLDANGKVAVAQLPAEAGGGVPTTGQSSRVYVTSSTGEQSQIPYSNTEAEASAMAQYTSGGELFAAAPTDPTHAANKAYVDGAIAAGGIQAPQTIEGPPATTVLTDAAPLTVVVNASLGSQVVTLASGISVGKRITLVRVDNGHPTLTVTINPDGWMINGQQANITLDAQWSVKTLIKVDDADWVIASQFAPQP
jgi:hypothetical protein